MDQFSSLSIFFPSFFLFCSRPRRFVFGAGDDFIAAMGGVVVVIIAIYFRKQSTCNTRMTKLFLHLIPSVSSTNTHTIAISGVRFTPPLPPRPRTCYH